MSGVEPDRQSGEVTTGPAAGDESRTAVSELLATMLEPDGYRVEILHWPESGEGRLRLRIVAGPGACEECLVPKSTLRLILGKRLPPGIVLEADDLVYPSDPSARSSNSPA